jgi:hypothetical protein
MGIRLRRELPCLGDINPLRNPEDTIRDLRAKLTVPQGDMLTVLTDIMRGEETPYMGLHRSGRAEDGALVLDLGSH